MNKRILKLIAEVDEFKGFWKGMDCLTSETLSNLRVLATIESIGSSTRIEGAKLSDREVAAILEGIDTRSFRSRDEQEVAGYDFVQYSSHERIVEANKNRYYLALREAQKFLQKQGASSFTWTEFFLEMMKKQKDELWEKIKREKMAYSLPQLSQDIFDLTRKHGRVTVSFLTTVLQANRNTVKKHVQQLNRAGKLVIHGKRRGVFYTLS